jgi:sucrose-phosphate synthase
MAGNEWINGYLEAILDSHTSSRGAGGGGGGDPRSPTKAASPRGAHMNFNPSHYFVEEVVKGVDESDLHRTWIKVVATRNARERSTRLENMCWRIWHLARKKKQVRVSRPPLSRLNSLAACSVFFIFTFSLVSELDDFQVFSVCWTD